MPSTALPSTTRPSTTRPGTGSDRPRPRRLTALAALGLALVAIVVSGCGPELGPVRKLTSIAAPRLPELFDPSVVRVDSTYYIYGSNNHLRAPVTRTTDIGRSYSLQAKNQLTSNAMPARPAWAGSSNPIQLWAPTVHRFGNTWVMYFSMDRQNPPQPNNPQCLGRATASSPMGPFTPDPSPAHCGLRGTGGALDPQFYVDKHGRAGLLAAFGDTESPIHHLSLDGAGRIVGSATPILARQHGWEYHFIENPAMVYDWTRDNYLLTYSAGRWWEGRYSTGIARCSTPAGPCTSDPSGPWVSSGAGRTGPGGLSFFTDTTGQTHGIFSTFAAGFETQNGGRSASIMPLQIQPAVGLGNVTK